MILTAQDTFKAYQKVFNHLSEFGAELQGATGIYTECRLCNVSLKTGQEAIKHSSTLGHMTKLASVASLKDVIYHDSPAMFAQFVNYKRKLNPKACASCKAHVYEFEEHNCRDSQEEVLQQAQKLAMEALNKQVVAQGKKNTFPKEKFLAKLKRLDGVKVETTVKNPIVVRKETTKDVAMRMQTIGEGDIRLAFHNINGITQNMTRSQKYDYILRECNGLNVLLCCMQETKHLSGEVW